MNDETRKQIKNLELMRRLELEHKALKKRLRDKGLIHTRTRATYAWKVNQGSAVTIRPEDVTGDAHFKPVGDPGGLWDIGPRTKETNLQTYTVYRTRGGWKQLLGNEFTKCCWGDGPYPTGLNHRYCTRQTCANCYVAEIPLATKGWKYFIKMDVYNPKSGNKIIDTAGTDPRGKRSGGKALHPIDRDPYILTSKLYKYKGKQQSQHDPAVKKLWRQEADEKGN